MSLAFVRASVFLAATAVCAMPAAASPMRVAASVALAPSLSAMGAAAQAQRDGYQYFEIGDVSAQRPAPTTPGVLLVGGGDWPYDAFRWFIERAGHGRIVILRASGTDEAQKEFFSAIGGIAAAQTIVFSDRRAASDAAVLRIVREADGLFLAGGDQANYVRYWKDTPLATLINARVAAGMPIGGTSAGLAILGAWGYGALDGGSITSPEALADPLGNAVTLVGDFLRVPRLGRVITDSHFSQRERLGRLIAFIARLSREHGRSDIVGLGIDEYTAVAIDGDGRGRVYSGNDGRAWIVTPHAAAPRLMRGEALTIRDVAVAGVGAGGSVQFPSMAMTSPNESTIVQVIDGKLGGRDETAGSRASTSSSATTMLVIHGGAGVERATMTATDEKASRDALTRALLAGHAVLKRRGTALDAVSTAITILEDDPQFNAGRGAVFTHDGRNELDAAVMDGATRRAGSVAGVQHIRNPIRLARAVMENSEHVMMVGEGAEAFAKSQGFERVDAAYFRTEKRWQQLQRALREEKAGQAHAEVETAKHFGTVGAVARDKHGDLAAGTSTGGMTNKRYGRVGDAPIIGAGTYADDLCAVSGTGWGEFYIRAVAAHEICARVRYGGQNIRDAANAVINTEIPKRGGDGGAIAMSSDGAIALPFNTEGMFRGWIGADGVPHVAIYKNDPLPLP
jgi:beta-aspartyl-peptidase (threonine type)